MMVVEVVKDDKEGNRKLVFSLGNTPISPLGLSTSSCIQNMGNSVYHVASTLIVHFFSTKTWWNWWFFIFSIITAHHCYNQMHASPIFHLPKIWSPQRLCQSGLLLQNSGFSFGTHTTICNEISVSVFDFSLGYYKSQKREHFGLEPSLVSDRQPVFSTY